MSALEEAPRVALTLEEAAKSLGISLSTFRRHVLPSLVAVRLGSAVVIPWENLQEWCRKRGTMNTPTD